MANIQFGPCKVFIALTDDSNGPPDHSESMFRTTFSAPGGPNGMA